MKRVHNWSAVPSAFFALIALFANTAAASKVGDDARITSVNIAYLGDPVSRGNAAYVVFDVAFSGTPPCVIGTTAKKALAFDITSARGQAILSMAMAAFLSGKRVKASGNGKCDLADGIETLNTIEIVR